jgi:hypothetical protein
MKFKLAFLFVLALLVTAMIAFAGPASAGAICPESINNCPGGGDHHNNNHNNGGNDGRNEDRNNGFDNSSVIQDPTETFVSGSNTNTGGAVTSTGDNSNTCAAQENFNNSGGVLNQQQVQQYASDSGGILFLGPAFTNAPDQTVTCTPTVQQSAASSSQ